MQFLKSCVCLGLMLAVCSGGSADETQPKKEKGKGKKVASATQTIVSRMELKDAQKEQVAAIDKEFMAKFQEITKARTEILTPEQRKAEKDAQKSARTAGMTQRESKAAVAEAVAMTDEQKEKMKAWTKTQTEFNGHVIEALKKVLTPEQQEKLPKPRGEKGKKKDKEAK